MLINKFHALESLDPQLRIINSTIGQASYPHKVSFSMNLADLDSEKTPQLVELVGDNQVMEHSFTYLLKEVPLSIDSSIGLKYEISKFLFSCKSFCLHV